MFLYNFDNYQKLIKNSFVEYKLLVNSNLSIDKSLIDMSTFRRSYCSWPSTGDTLYLDLVTHKEKNNKYNWREVLRGNEINELFITNHFESEKDYPYVFLFESFQTVMIVMLLIWNE